MYKCASRVAQGLAWSNTSHISVDRTISRTDAEGSHDANGPLYIPFPQKVLKHLTLNGLTDFKHMNE